MSVRHKYVLNLGYEVLDTLKIETNIYKYNNTVILQN